MVWLFGEVYQLLTSKFYNRRSIIFLALSSTLNWLINIKDWVKLRTNVKMNTIAVFILITWNYMRHVIYWLFRREFSTFTWFLHSNQPKLIPYLKSKNILNSDNPREIEFWFFLPTKQNSMKSPRFTCRWQHGTLYVPKQKKPVCPCLNLQG